MHLEQIPLQFQKLSRTIKLNYSLGNPSSSDDIFEAESRLNLTFPKQVRLFYESYNGLQVEEPRLEFFPLAQLHFTDSHKLLFATISDAKHQIYFDTSRLNEAEQWNIMSAEDYRITLTMASFWSNKIWAWLKNKREI